MKNAIGVDFPRRCSAILEVGQPPSTPNFQDRVIFILPGSALLRPVARLVVQHTFRLRQVSAASTHFLRHLSQPFSLCVSSLNAEAGTRARV